jgi:hypothetical protein
MSSPTPAPKPVPMSVPVPVPQISCHCAPARPWVCNPNEITQNDYMSPFGCKKPNEVYDPMSHQCCACDVKK